MKKVMFHPDIYTFQIDFNQHVSNIVYIEWMEIGRLKLLAEVGLAVHTLVEMKITPVLIKTEITYKKPLVLGDLLTVEMWVGQLQRTSAELVFRFLRNGGEVAAEGQQLGLFLNTESMRPHRLTEEQRALFTPYCAQIG